MLPPLPLPESPEDRALWKQADDRLAILEDRWGDQLQSALEQFFSAETLSRFSVLDRSRNPAAYAWNALNTLYVESPTVAAGSTPTDVLALTATAELWCHRQEAQLRAIAMGESLIRLDLRGERIHYRCVHVGRVELWVDQERPGAPAAVRETRPRQRDAGRWVWTRELWDPAGVATGVPGMYSVEEYIAKDGVFGGGSWVDATAAWYPDREEAPYPYVDPAGAPVLPYVLVHSRMHGALRSPSRGEALVAATLGAGALHTFWVHGMRDHALPQPFVIDALPAGAVTDPTKDGAERMVRRDPASFVVFSSKNGLQGAVSQLQSSMDPMATLQAIDAYVASALRDAGLGPTDEAPAKGVSGVAISVSREALRRSQHEQRPAAEDADRWILSTAARMLQGIGAPGAAALPVDPESYSLSYRGIAPSIEEVMAAAQRQDILLRLGLTERWRAIREVHPHLSDVEAQAMAARIEAAGSSEPQPEPEPNQE